MGMGAYELDGLATQTKVYVLLAYRFRCDLARVDAIRRKVFVQLLTSAVTDTPIFSLSSVVDLPNR